LGQGDKMKQEELIFQILRDINTNSGVMDYTAYKVDIETFGRTIQMLLDDGIVKGAGVFWADDTVKELVTDNIRLTLNGISYLKELENNFNKLYKEGKTMDGIEGVFISHSSSDSKYAKCLIKLLKNIGVRGDKIFCSSVPGYKIELGENFLDYIKEKFIKGNSKAYSVELKTNDEIVEHVKNDIGGIGYVGVGFLTDSTGKPNGKIWAMPIHIDNHRAYSPYEPEAVKNGDYVLTRPLYQYVKGIPGGAIEDFILFELTKKGQDIVNHFGFFPINDNQVQINRLKGL